MAHQDWHKRLLERVRAALQRIKRCISCHKLHEHLYCHGVDVYGWMDFKDLGHKGFIITWWIWWSRKHYLNGSAKLIEFVYISNVVLMLLKTTYGLNSAEKVFCRELLMAFSAMGCRRSNSYPCMYFKWT